MSSQKNTSGRFRVNGGRIKPSQLITTFGPGSVVDLPDDSVMIAGIDHWPKGRRIRELRLEQMLGRHYFQEPSMGLYDGDIPAVTFPRSRVCSNRDCGRIVNYDKKCPECQKETYPARLIVICPQGHADDFPWSSWVHRGKNVTCSGPRICLVSMGSTATLADLVVTCKTCGSRQSLAGALGSQAVGTHCRGDRPWLVNTEFELCQQQPRSVLRGASNVYFSSLISALSIPPWTSPIQAAIDVHWTTLQELPEATQRMLIPQLSEFTGFNIDDILRAMKERQSNTTTNASLRVEEFRAFRNPGTGIKHDDFYIRAEPLAPSLARTIKQVVLADRLREVRVLQGFTRIDPPDQENPDAPIVPISANAQQWLPAVENRGEGIFFELDEERVRRWEQLSAVQQRVQRIGIINNRWRTQRHLPPIQNLLPRHVLIHTLAHLFIRQLSLDCGYSSASLRERIYTGDTMCGLLIYTASSDSDGSLGGLVLQGGKTRFEATMNALLENARWCSSDPLCTEHDGMTSGQVKGAACHACALVSETSCEFSNRLLDRALVCTLPGMKETGYFDSIL